MSKPKKSFENSPLLIFLLADMELNHLEHYSKHFIPDDKREAICLRVEAMAKKIYEKESAKGVADRKIKKYIDNGRREAMLIWVRHWLFAYVADRRDPHPDCRFFQRLYQNDRAVQEFAMGKELPK